MMNWKSLAIASVLALLVLLTVILWQPWPRVELFKALGYGDWAYRALTTLDEKIAMFNEHYSSNGEPQPIHNGIGCGFGLFFCNGSEMVIAVSKDPFVLEVEVDRARGIRASMERVDDNTLVYHSQEYPITFTFTKTEPDPNIASDHTLAFYMRASRQELPGR